MKKPTTAKQLDLTMTCETMEMPRKICGVYFLLLQGKVMYVGQSENIHVRIWAHEQMKVFDRFVFIQCLPAELNALERKWIRFYDPPWKCDEINNPSHPRYVPPRLPPVRISSNIRRPLGERLTEAHGL